MRINTDQLYAFWMVVTSGGVHRAAERMNLSQPTVTARIKNLEDQLAVQLFLANPVVTYARNTRPYREPKRALRDRYGPEVMMFPSSSLSASFRLARRRCSARSLGKVGHPCGAPG